MAAKDEGRLVVGTCRKARFRFDIVEEYEAGLCLKGPEVKSLRGGKVTLDGAFALENGGELFLHNLYIAPYAANTTEPLDPARPRKLLLRRSELGRLIGRQRVKGLSLVPLEIYFRRGWAKVKLALARGRRGPDKRDSIRKKDAARDKERAFKKRY